MTPLPDPATAHRVGVVVPPSNPVVEPELVALLGGDVLLYGSRLPRFTGLTLEERNQRYVPAYSEALDGLIGLDVTCALIAMTGPTYRFGVAGDRDLCADLSRDFGAPVLTVSLAIYDSLLSMGVSRLNLLSPYPDWLTEHTVDYWTAAGFNVVGVEHMLGEGEQFSAYETTTDEVVTHLRRIDPEPGSAVLLTGTGLVSVSSIYRVSYGCRVPILSSNLCGAWWILHQCGRGVGSDLYQEIAPGNMPGPDEPCAAWCDAHCAPSS